MFLDKIPPPKTFMAPCNSSVFSAPVLPARSLCLPNGSPSDRIPAVCRGSPIKSCRISADDDDPTASLIIANTQYKDSSRRALSRPLSVSDHSSSPDNGPKIRVSFRGLPGSFTEEAAFKAFPNCKTVPCDEFEDAFKAVELWLADKAVLPIENTTGGSVHRNYDLLLRHRLHIVGEVKLTTKLSLLALPGVTMDQLKRVLSHWQALELSNGTLTKLGVARENVEDAATAAQLVAKNKLRDAGVVASARAAEIYGLNVLSERIQDNFGNMTRYLILAREPIMPTKANKSFKTSIVFTLNEGPGILFKALAVFALRDINLTKIESRPQGKQPVRVVDDSNSGSAKYFDYLFFIDFEASMAEPRAQNALAHLQDFATFLRVLGCYPMDSNA